MPHVACRPLPLRGNLAQRYKVSCKIITSNLANWLHGIMPDLWRGGMRACDVLVWKVKGKIAYREKHYSVGTHF